MRKGLGGRKTNKKGGKHDLSREAHKKKRGGKASNIREIRNENVGGSLPGRKKRKRPMCHGRISRGYDCERDRKKRETAVRRKDLGSPVWDPGGVGTRALIRGQLERAGGGGLGGQGQKKKKSNSQSPVGDIRNQKSFCKAKMLKNIRVDRGKHFSQTDIEGGEAKNPSRGYKEFHNKQALPPKKEEREMCIFGAGGGNNRGERGEGYL